MHEQRDGVVWSTGPRPGAGLFVIAWANADQSDVVACPERQATGWAAFIANQRMVSR